MKAHVIEAMAVSGIVSDTPFDHLVTQAATAPTTPGPASGAGDRPSGEPTTDPENPSQAESPAQVEDPEA